MENPEGRNPHTLSPQGQVPPQGKGHLVFCPWWQRAKVKIALYAVC